MVAKRNSQALEQTVVIGVRADPEPDHGIIKFDSHDTPAAADANGIGFGTITDVFVLETGEVWVTFPELVILRASSWISA